MASSVSVMVALLCLVAGAHSFPTPMSVTAKNYSWDYLLFVQRHPPGVCYGEDNCGYPANATEWVIHGLWPTDEDSEGPNYCNSSATFNGKILEGKVQYEYSPTVHQLQSMWPTLVAEWTNMETDTAFDSFWSHEYLKHGTCAEVLPALSTELKFFQIVVSMFEQQFNIRPVLEKAGIKPSNTTPYSFDDFNNAVVKHFGVKPFLECSYNKVPPEKKQVLTQIYLCLKKDLKTLRECSDFVFHEEGACWSNETVYYLESKWDGANRRQQRQLDMLPLT